MVTVEQQQKLEEIIVNQWITPVYQPIVSLQDGSVLGFEALSRVEKPGIFDNIEEMFQCAEESGCIWMLEQVCRRAILRGVYDQKNVLDQYHAKIFINVSPKVLHDEKFGIFGGKDLLCLAFVELFFLFHEWFPPKFVFFILI